MSDSDPQNRHFATVKNNHLVGDRLDLIEMLRCDDDRDRFLEGIGDRPQILEEFVPGENVEGCKRLVENEQQSASRRALAPVRISFGSRQTGWLQVEC